MVASFEVKYTIDLDDISEKHAQFSSYEPEVFPGLIYRMMKPKLVLLIFVSGKIVITGAKSKRHVHKAFLKILPVLE